MLSWQFMEVYMQGTGTACAAFFKGADILHAPQATRQQHDGEHPGF